MNRYGAGGTAIAGLASISVDDLIEQNIRMDVVVEEMEEEE